MSALIAERTAGIPSDYPSLQAAVAGESGWLQNGVGVVLLIQSAHVLTSGLSLERGDYRNYEIRAEDDVVLAEVEGPILKGAAASMPRLACLIDAQGQGGAGYELWDGASAVVEAGAGVKNAAHHGLYVVRGSRVVARGAVFTGAGQQGGDWSGCFVSRACTADIEFADFSGCAGLDGIVARRASMVAATSAKATNARRNGINASRAYVVAEDADVRGAGAYGLLAGDGGVLVASGADARDCALGPMSTGNGGIIVAPNVQTNNGIRDEVATPPLRFALTVPAGEVHTLDLGSVAIGIVLLACTAASAPGRPSGMLHYRVGASPFLAGNLIDATDVVLTTGALTEESGSSGEFLISAHTDGRLYFLNRTSSALSFRMTVTR